MRSATRPVHKPTVHGQRNCSELETFLLFTCRTFETESLEPADRETKALAPFTTVTKTQHELMPTMTRIVRVSTTRACLDPPALQATFSGWRLQAAVTESRALSAASHNFCGHPGTASGSEVSGTYSFKCFEKEELRKLLCLGRQSKNCHGGDLIPRDSCLETMAFRVHASVFQLCSWKRSEKKNKRVHAKLHTPRKKRRTDPKRSLQSGAGTAM